MFTRQAHTHAQAHKHARTHTQARTHKHNHTLHSIRCEYLTHSLYLIFFSVTYFSLHLYQVLLLTFLLKIIPGNLLLRRKPEDVKSGWDKGAELVLLDHGLYKELRDSFRYVYE